MSRPEPRASSGRRAADVGCTSVGVADWDRELTPPEVKRLPPKVRGARALLSFERKVIAIEQAAADVGAHGAPPEVPKDRAKLRRWSDAGRGMWQWSTPAFDDPHGDHSDLALRFAAAIERIALRARKGQAGLRREVADRDIQIAQLEAQIMQLVGENHGLRSRLASQRGPGAA